MTIRVELQKEAAKVLQHMAKEAGMGLRDMVEIGAYNLVAVWAKEHPEQLALLVPDDLDGTK